MKPKRFQLAALESLAAFCDALKTARAKVAARIKALEAVNQKPEEEDRDYLARAWKDFAQSQHAPEAARKAPYLHRFDARKRPYPNVCLRVPTGGGKTYLGALALGRLNIHSGVVLWITPSKAIFAQTWRALATREHPCRQALERASGRRVKLLKKDDPLVPEDAQNYLCVMPLMLQATGREDRDFLKIYRHHARYAKFFPAVDAAEENDKFLREHPDLELQDLTEGAQTQAPRHSLHNALKLLRPVIVADEAHHIQSRHSEMRRGLIGKLNPRFVLEMSATPEAGACNIVADVSGLAMKEEEMIKLPLNIHNFENADWKYTLKKAQEKLDDLENAAQRRQSQSGDYIRPIMVVRTERVGKEQIGGDHIHAEDARNYLVGKLGMPPESAVIITGESKNSDREQIVAEKLMSRYSPIRFIITKDALKEGWDCPFAYILALLDPTRGRQALTQMAGRVLRQPHARQTGIDALDECYVYCFDRDVAEAVGQVKDGLEREGLGDLGAFIRDGKSDKQSEGARRVIINRRRGREMKIFLPLVLHRDGRKRRPLDYERDILRGVNWTQLAAQKWNAGELQAAAVKEVTDIVNIGEIGAKKPATQNDADIERTVALEYIVRRAGGAAPNPWLIGDMARRATEALRAAGESEADIFDRRVAVAEEIKIIIARRVEQKAESLFRAKLKNGDIKFELVAEPSFAEARFELPARYSISVGRDDKRLRRRHDDALQRSLFDDVYARDFNQLEKEFALYLDGEDAVHWWHRLAARQDYALQGWRRHRVYPDFVVCALQDDADRRKMLLLETKGMHLSGNKDVEYKQKLFAALEAAAPTAQECGEMELRQNGKSYRMKLRMMFADSYRKDFQKLLTQ